MYTAIISTSTQRHYTMKYQNEIELLQAINKDFVQANTDYNADIYFLIPKHMISQIKVEIDE